jgi:predicted ABC-type ATPase
MTAMVPRVRMFAGPNGSGKSTIRTLLRPELIGVYINPDEIQSTLRQTGRLDLAHFEVNASPEELSQFFAASTLIEKAGLTSILPKLRFENNTMAVPDSSINAYLASVAADFIRRKLVATEISFTFETVMSSPDKTEFLKTARTQGYRTYLYFIATEDPAINVSRVRNRVTLGGHDVPEDKIVARYHRSISLLLDAIRQSDRAYVFDNSSSQQRWIAEITDGHQLELKAGQVPLWFQRAVLDKVTAH